MHVTCGLQMRTNELQLFKTTTSDEGKLRRQVKKNKIRNISDASQAVYPRQPMIATADESRTAAVDRQNQSLGDGSDKFTTTNVLDGEQKLSAWN